MHRKLVRHSLLVTVTPFDLILAIEYSLNKCPSGLSRSDMTCLVGNSMGHLLGTAAVVPVPIHVVGIPTGTRS